MWNWIEKLDELGKQNKKFALVTIIKHDGSTPRESGSKMIVTDNGDFFGTVGGGAPEKKIIENAIDSINKSQNGIFKYSLTPKEGQQCGGQFEVFIEVMNGGPVLYIFGAGHVAQAVCQVLQETPFKVHLIDERMEWLEKASKIGGVTTHHKIWNESMDEIAWDDTNTYAVAMTHDHQHDFEIVEALTERPLRYLGMIASPKKAQTLKNNLIAKGVEKKCFEKLKCPIGLHKAGKSPKEIAISFAAELLAIHYGQINTKKQDE